MSLKGNVYIDSGNAMPMIYGSENFELRDNTAFLVDGPTVVQPPGGHQSIQRVAADAPAVLEGSWSRVPDVAATPGQPTLSLTDNGPIISEFSDAADYHFEFIEIYCDIAN